MNLATLVIVGTLFFIFSLLQASFLPFFAIYGAIPNMVFVLFFTMLFFENHHFTVGGFVTAVMAGFFSDMFLPSYFGVSIGVFLMVFFLYNGMRYFLHEKSNSYAIFNFISLCAVLLFTYNGLLYLIGRMLGFEFIMGVTTIISMAYSFPFVAVGFYLGKKLLSKNFDSQLTLL